MTKYNQAISQAQQSLTSANAGVTSAQSGVAQSENALAGLQVTADPGHPAGASTNTLTTRYELAQTQCGSPPVAGSKSEAGVSCSQVSNLLSFVKNVQAAQSGVTQAQTSVSQAQNGVTSAQQQKTSGEMQDQQQIQSAQSQLTSANTQYQSTVVNNAVKEEPAEAGAARAVARVGRVGSGAVADRAEERA